MATKEIKTRIALRTGDYAYWTTGAGKDLELIRGEVCICTIDEVGDPGDKNGAARTAPTVLFKVCDTTGKKFSQLNWVSALAADVYDWAKKNEVSVTGSGNAITAVEIKDDTLTFTKGTTFATKQELEGLRDGLEADTNTTYQFSIPESGDDKGKLLIEKKEVGDSSWTKVGAYDFVTPSELETILEDYVKSVDKVDNTAIEIVNTDPQKPKVGLKIDSTQGNVTLTQSSAGLKASIDLSGYATKEEMSTAMVFKGTLGTGGTIETLPAATKDTVGDTYKVITAGTYQNIAAKVGDAFICQDGTAPAWVLIPSGDEPSGTVTNVAAGEGLATESGSAITTSGTINHATPTGAAEGDHKGTGTRTYITNVKTDKFGHVVGFETGSETDQALPSATGSATIASVSDGVVTLKTGATLSEENGNHKLGNSSGEDITLAKVATTASAYDLAEASVGTDKDGNEAIYFILDCNW